MVDATTIADWIDKRGIPWVIVVFIMIGLWRATPVLFNRLVNWCERGITSLEKTHEAIAVAVLGLRDDTRKIADGIDHVRCTHGQAIEHTADGLLAHVDGKTEEARALAVKAKEVVK